MLTLLATSIGLVVIQFRLSQFSNSGFTANADWWGRVIIPLCAAGLLAGFLTLYGGLAAGLLISAPLVIFTYYSPILPVAEWHILALVGVAGPAMGLWISEGIFAGDTVEDTSETSRRFTAPSVAWVLTAVIALCVFWFSFGFFGFRPAFVPSGSMEPNIHHGDLVLAGPTSPTTLKVGDIAMYEMPGRLRILHRIQAIERDQDQNRYFVFKGDNNNVADPVKVRDNQIKGKYIGRIPKVGWLPLRFNQLIGKAIR